MHAVDVTMFWAERSGGVRRYLTAKHRWASGRPDLRLSLVLPGRVGAVPTTGVAACVPSLPIPWSAGYRLPIGRAPTRRVLERLHPDVIEAGDPFAMGRAAVQAARTVGCPAVAWFHSDLAAVGAREAGRWLGAPAARLAERATEGWLRRVYADFDLVLAPSRHAAERLARMGVPGVAFQPLGVDTAAFAPGIGGRWWRQALGLTPDARMLLYVGRFAPEKRIDILVEAIRLLGPPHVLVAIGAGPMPPHGAGVLRLPFAGSTEMLAGLYGSADLLVHAGDCETFGLAALEAMSCGLPVVASARGALAELVDDGVGCRVEDIGARGFSDAIRATLLRERAPMALAARRRALAHDWNHVLPRLFARYRRLLAGAGAATEVATPVITRVAAMSGAGRPSTR